MSGRPLTRLAIRPFWPELGRDELFDPESPYNSDDSLRVNRLLRERLEALGGFCHTLDVCIERGLEPDVVLFGDIPREPLSEALAGLRGQPLLWVTLNEAEAVLPHNWIDGATDPFDRVFTWSDRHVDGVRTFKLQLPNPTFTLEPFETDHAERNLCTLVQANKWSAHPLELYSERRRVIRWFEQHHPDEFRFYGHGWNAPGDQERFAGYGGPIEHKLEVLRRYWFTICFENVRGVPGYITEKIFDCFRAQTVPVYLGADNVQDFIPRETFLDMREFESLESLYRRMTTIEPDEYLAYLEAARRFVSSDAARPFFDTACVDLYLKHLAAAGHAVAA